MQIERARNINPSATAVATAPLATLAHQPTRAAGEDPAGRLMLLLPGPPYARRSTRHRGLGSSYGGWHPARGRFLRPRGRERGRTTCDARAEVSRVRRSVRARGRPAP